jgi:hypothetical protein
MNIQSFNAGMAGLDSMRDALLEREMRKKKDAQQAIDNNLRQAMYELQKRGQDATIANAEREFGFRKERAGVDDTRYVDQRDYSRGRDTLADTRYVDQRDYSRGRDTLADTRYVDQRDYSRGRDALADTRYDTEREYRKLRDTVGDTRASDAFDLQKMQIAAQMAAAGRKDDVTVRGYGDDGQTYSYRIPKKDFKGMNQDQPPGQQMTRQQLLEGVRSGKYTKEQAKTIAKQMGWN